MKLSKYNLAYNTQDLINSWAKKTSDQKQKIKSKCIIKYGFVKFIHKYETTKIQLSKSLAEKTENDRK